MDEQTFVGFLLIVIGGFQALRPDIMLDFQVWVQRVVMNAKYEPSERTAMVVRGIGVFITLLGFFVITGAIQ